MGQYGSLFKRLSQTDTTAAMAEVILDSCGQVHLPELLPETVLLLLL